jgi:class 3 adenylate cyclase/predicted ATPase/tetratricopeptide (TPR) repeat protein
LSGSTTLTFLFTDIESSTPLWELYPQAMVEAMAVHDVLLAEAIERYGGSIVKNTGDGIFAMFVGGRPLHAAVDIVRTIASRPWSLPQPLRVRIGLHSVSSLGEGSSYFVHEGDAFGPAVIRAARVMDSAWGGQIVATSSTIELTEAVEGARVEALGEHLLRGIDEPLALYSVSVAELEHGPFPPPRTLSARYLNLPTPESPLIGRDVELAAITEHLRRQRLVTIGGPGGIGKTRLAIAAAAAMVDQFRHGIIYVEAGGARTAESLLAAIEGAAGRRSYGGASAVAELTAFLSSRHLLLVLDNLDEPEATRSTVADLLSQCADLAILVTARERLRLADEWTVVLGPLDSDRPDRSHPARQAPDAELFVRAAARNGVWIGDTPQDMATISRICRLCGGVPLALELAAASLGPETLDGLADSLERGAQSPVAADDAIASLFDRFWNELGPSEREVVGSLAVFDGPFSPELARKVAGASPFLLHALRERAVISVRSAAVRTPAEHYQLHPVFRAQASRRLEPSVADRARDQYIAAIGDELADAYVAIDGPGRPDLLASLAAQLTNVRGAWRLMADRGRYDLMEYSLEGLFRFHEVMGWLGQGADLLAGAAEALDSAGRGSTALNGRILSRLAGFRGRMGDERAALAALERSLAIAAESRDDAGETFARFTLGRIQLQNGYYREARSSLEASRRGFAAAGDPLGSARCDLYLGRVAYQQGDMTTASDLAVLAVAAFEEAGDPGDAASAQRELALARLLSGEVEAARHLLLETLARFERLGDRLGWAESMQCLGYAATRVGNDDEATRCFEQSLAEFRGVGVASHVAADLDNLALLAIRREDLDEAERFLRECISVAASAGIARIVLDACIGVVEVLAGRGEEDDARALLAVILRDPRLDRSDSGPRFEALARRLGAPSDTPRSVESEQPIRSIADLAVRSLARA